MGTLLPARWLIVGLVVVVASCADGGGASNNTPPPTGGPGGGSGGPGGGSGGPGGGSGGDGGGSGGPSIEACSEVTWPAPAGCTATDLEGKLRCIPGLTVTPQAADPSLPNYQRFELTITQPIDHDHPELGSFQQRVRLLHTRDTAPMVLATGGYNLGVRTGRTELTRMLEANQIAYEHRYFAASRPVPTDWSKLDIRQAALDAHRIASALHWLYPGRWVNTGASKGGMTSVYHRRFHPCDVDATVAFVAPTSLGAADPAYTAFLEQVGGADHAECRANLVVLQRRLLEQRAQIEPLVEGTFVHIPKDKAFELAVVELHFAFWQYTRPGDPTYGCTAIPPATAAPDEMRAFLELHSPVDVLAGEASLDLFHAYYHQAAHQLGAPAPYEAPLADLLRYPGADVPATFIPAGEVTAFDTAAMPDVNDWVKTHGERMLFIYGEFDPWSSREFEPSSRDSVRYTVAGGNHGASIAQLAEADRVAVSARLGGWLDVAVPVARGVAPASIIRLPDGLIGELDDADPLTRRPPR